MLNIIKSLGLILFLIVLLCAAYFFAVKPEVSKWGALRNEVKMSIPGDELAPFIESTRGITINAPQQEVWQWLMQIGADRGGFYSYSFIEKALGYETREPELMKPVHKSLEVGDVIRGSIEPENSLIVYEFPVVYVKEGEAFVLENWGSFMLKRINAKRTRLVVRTRGFETSSLREAVEENVGMALHYIMERRMLMGIKARAEAGEDVALLSYPDILWFAGIVLSIIGIFLLVFIQKGIISIVVPSALSAAWLGALFILNPIPLYSGVLFIGVLVALVFSFNSRGAY